MQPSLTPGDDISGLWHELGELYAAAAEDARKATFGGFVVACVTAAQVLLSAPLFGTSWAGPSAALIPPTAGILFGGGSLWWRRAKFSKRREALRRKLAVRGEDADRPTARGLGTYYDAQLILLRCEYELLRSRRTKRAFLAARLLENSFGFTPEDGFECGPLNAAPDTPEMKALRELWEARLSMKKTLQKTPPPSLGLEEDVNYRVFPREMTVSAELAMRGAYLGISCKLLRESYGERPDTTSGEVRRRARRDLEEYAAITGRGAR